MNDNLVTSTLSPMNSLAIDDTAIATEKGIGGFKDITSAHLVELKSLLSYYETQLSEHRSIIPCEMFVFGSKFDEALTIASQMHSLMTGSVQVREKVFKTLTSTIAVMVRFSSSKGDITYRLQKILSDITISMSALKVNLMNMASLMKKEEINALAGTTFEQLISKLSDIGNYDLSRMPSAVVTSGSELYEDNSYSSNFEMIEKMVIMKNIIKE